MKGNSVIYTCDHCGSQVAWPAEKKGMPANWMAVLGYDLCGRCVGAVGLFISGGANAEPSCSAPPHAS